MKYVDISAYCNAKWITNCKDGTEGIECVVLQNEYLTNGKIEGHGFSFMSSAEGNDAIICAGQRVKTENGNDASKLDIAYFAVFGLFIETVILEYESGLKEDLTLGFKDVLWLRDEYSHITWTDLRCRNPCGEKVLEFFYPRDGIDMRGAVWAHRVPLKKGEKLAAVLLPDNGFINICGLTLR